MEDVYRNIKAKRIEHGYSQQKLAEMVGYKGKSMIAKIEKGLVDLPLPMVSIFANALGCSESELMGWSDFDYDEETHTWEYAENKNQKYIVEFTELSKELSEDDLKRIIAIAKTFVNREE